jgi:hypothetical protein
MPLNPGTRLGAYEIQAPAGPGGMDEVYRARHTHLVAQWQSKSLLIIFSPLI